LKLGPKWLDPEERRVFDRGDGGMIHPDTLRYFFVEICGAADVPVFRIHDQRHTNATEDLAACTNPKIVVDHLGIPVQTLLPTHGRALPSAHREAAAAFEARMKAAAEAPAEHDNIAPLNGTGEAFAPISAPMAEGDGEKSASRCG